jgi:integrase/recombinase XerD
MVKPTNFAYYLSKYLTTYLPEFIGASSNTVASYSDSFHILLIFASEKDRIKPEKLTLAHIDKSFVSRFVEWIENERGCSVSTRNLRLTAIHAFFRFLQSEIPEKLYDCQEILSIRKKKSHQECVNFLTTDGIKLLLSEPNSDTESGRKHMVLLSFIYGTAARVQEAVDVTIEDFGYNGHNLVRLTGKGNKSRLVPLEKPMLAMMRGYLKEQGHIQPYINNATLFTNHSRNKLTRQGISHIFKKYADSARKKRPDLIPRDISLHSLRHSRAVHWLQAGVDLIYIRDLLGHVSVQTTEIYARIDGEMKRKALEKVSSQNYPAGIESWQSDISLLDWLKTLGR